MPGPDLLYIVRPDGDHDNLRYSLRSAATFLPHGRIWIAGYRPDWCRNVRHIDVQEIPGAKFGNIHAAMLAACQHPNMSAQFTFFNDDMFIMRPLRDGVPMLHRGLLQQHLRKSLARLSDGGRFQDLQSHKQGGVDSLWWLEDQGVDEPLSYDLHVPMPIDKHAMADTLHRTAHVAPGFMRSLYGNLYQLGGRRMSDVKAERAHSQTPHGPFISVHPRAWDGATGRYVRRKLRQPCQYERDM